MKIVFMGTPEFSVPCLEACVNEHEVLAVFTQPDRPKGRGKKIAFPPVKDCALKNNLEVYQPEKLKTKENYDIINELNPDVIIVVAYGQILSKEILEIPKYGCINVHASLLPKYRGASPIHWSIVKGEKITGITTMLMDEGLDTGDILLKRTTDITEDMSAGELHDILMNMGSKLLIDTLNNIENIKRIKQTGENSYAPLLNKKMAKIDWNKNAFEILRFINGLNPWPLAWCKYNGETVKFFSGELTDEKSNNKPGTINMVNKDGLFVNTKDFVIKLKDIQFFKSKKMHISQYILGHNIDQNSKFE
ncbi:methionyl-tRNA formyltransferase [Helicovermis profundi]|uniref:Methionyl-tRNA formyltransferase n=1 Tax=Helicovermis profundi TaxID=3065157 RepID=A0AAU9E9M6_9FIRM|nr:methionyl-tRNA formyltransferase [Clostridia bacterium S502]